MSQQGKLRQSELDTLTGNSGGAVSPDGSGDINIVGSNGITTVGNPATQTITINMNSPFTGDFSFTGNVSLTGAATQLKVEGGAVTDFIGTATLSSGTVTVNNTNIAAADHILLTYQGGSLSNTGALSYTISAGNSFTIESTNGSDANNVSYFIVRQL